MVKFKRFKVKAANFYIRYKYHKTNVMTSSRIVRGTKIRIFLYLCGVIIILGLLACYNNSLSQLDDSQKSVEICRQQHENLSTQLQVISEYKIKLDKALKIEKAEHARSNSSFSQLLSEEKEKTKKNLLDSKMRFDSLHQTHNLLQTEFEDYKEKSGKTQEEQLQEINDLKAKINELQEEIKNVEHSKEKIKSDYINVHNENEDLKNQLKEITGTSVGNENKTMHLLKVNKELEMELKKIKDKCPNYDDLPDPIVEMPKKEEPLDVEPLKDVAPIPQENVLAMPQNQDKKSSTSSTLKVSQGSLNGARPLVIPTITPKNKPVEINNNPIPVPEKMADLKQNNDIVDNRYQNQIEEVKKGKEDNNENVAKEVFDQQNVDNDGIAFNDAIKQIEKKNIPKQHIDSLVNKKNQLDYQESQNGQLENALDEAEDDDQDEYDDHRLARQKDPAIRN